jgi:signal transduction histidine kinase
MLPLNVESAGSGFDLMRLLRGAHWYLITRIRGSFADVGYATLLVISLNIYNFLVRFLSDEVDLSLASRLHGAVQSAIGWSVLTLPSILILGVALRLAPPQGALRWTWAIGAAALCTLWSNRCVVLLFHEKPGFEHIADGFVLLVLICVSCFLHNTMRHSKADLFRAELDSTALEAEFNRAQLDLLRAQVEPHFLFNTLATVRTLAHTAPRTAAVLVDNLLRYLMAALPKLRNGESSLQDETELIEAYLRIQQVRMGVRLSYDVTIPNALKSLRVPSVMLLTLVENAVKHGIGPAADGGCVRVIAAQEAANLVLTVIDTGLGMQAQVGYGSGLANIRARLALLYRERASLSLEAASPRGVAAKIKLPMGAPV